MHVLLQQVLEVATAASQQFHPQMNACLQPDNSVADSHALLCTSWLSLPLEAMTLFPNSTLPPRPLVM
jgi:hypothetical protein